VYAKYQAVRDLKVAELERIREGNASIVPIKSRLEISQKWDEICSVEPMKSLLISGCFYLEFARVDRAEQEAANFLTERGGSYLSKKTGVLKVSKKSRPILTHEDGSIIKRTELFAAGFQMMCLFQKRNHLNVAALEKHAQQSTLNLASLHRDYCGGAKVPEDTRHMEFGLYIIFKLDGYSPFNLNL
jgi:hypothetical protein